MLHLLVYTMSILQSKGVVNTAVHKWIRTANADTISQEENVILKQN